LAVNAPVLCVPDAPLVPDQEPDAVQPVALVVLHVSCDAEPDCTLVGAVANAIVGAASSVTAAVCDTVPPGPTQLRA